MQNQRIQQDAHSLCRGAAKPKLFISISCTNLSQCICYRQHMNIETIFISVSPPLVIYFILWHKLPQILTFPLSSSFPQTCSLKAFGGDPNSRLRSPRRNQSRRPPLPHKCNKGFFYFSILYLFFSFPGAPPALAVCRAPPFSSARSPSHERPHHTHSQILLHFAAILHRLH